MTRSDADSPSMRASHDGRLRHEDTDVTAVITAALTIEVGASEGVVIGIEADRIAWAQDAWAIWHRHMATLSDDGRVLQSVDSLEIARKPLARNTVLVTIGLTYMQGGSATGPITEAEAKRQFWALVCGAWGTLRRSASQAASQAQAARAAA